MLHLYLLYLIYRYWRDIKRKTPCTITQRELETLIKTLTEQPHLRDTFLLDRNTLKTLLIYLHTNDLIELTVADTELRIKITEDAGRKIEKISTALENRLEITISDTAETRHVKLRDIVDNAIQKLKQDTRQLGRQEEAEELADAIDNFLSHIMLKDTDSFKR